MPPPRTGSVDRSTKGENESIAPWSDRPGNPTPQSAQARDSLPDGDGHVAGLMDGIFQALDRLERRHAPLTLGNEHAIPVCICPIHAFLLAFPLFFFLLLSFCASGL